MKSILMIAVVFATLTACGQGGTKPSPPATAKQTIESGATISINYSQPAVKGRTIGKDLEPMEGKVWRTGANEATVFETDKSIKVEGKDLPAGTYGLFTQLNGEVWTIIFNRTSKQWGAFNYKEADDALRVNVKGKKAKEFAERMTFVIEKDGDILLTWGEKEVEFKVK